MKRKINFRFGEAPNLIPESELPETILAIIAQYRNIEDLVVPSMDELQAIFSHYGAVQPATRGGGFAVINDQFGNPFPLRFRIRESAWVWWLKNGRNRILWEKLKRQEVAA